MKSLGTNIVLGLNLLFTDSVYVTAPAQWVCLDRGEGERETGETHPGRKRLARKWKRLSLHAEKEREREFVWPQGKRKSPPRTQHINCWQRSIKQAIWDERVNKDVKTNSDTFNKQGTKYGLNWLNSFTVLMPFQVSNFKNLNLKKRNNWLISGVCYTVRKLKCPIKK